MRDVVMMHFMSLDGVSEEPSDWTFDSGPELLDLVRRVIATQDDVLLGRGTFDYWADHWPTSDMEPFAPFINATTKHVATSSALGRHWDNTVVMDQPPLDYVRSLKDQQGGDIGLHGSTQLSRSLVSAGLVDRMVLVVPSNLAGHGARLFADGDPLQRFELTSVGSSAAGTVFLDYRQDLVDASGDPVDR